jgi:hypothetical protein
VNEDYTPFASALSVTLKIFCVLTPPIHWGFKCFFCRHTKTMQNGAAFEAIDAYVINADNQPDPWHATVDAFRGSQLRFHRRTACDSGPSWKRRATSHTRLVGHAARQKHPFLIVVEDTCTPQGDPSTWPAHLHALLQFLQANKAHWDIVVLGAVDVVCDNVNARPLVGVTATHLPLLRCSQFYQTPFIIYNASAYNHVLLWNGSCTLDTWLHPLRTWIPVPFLCVQPVVPASPLEDRKQPNQKAFEEAEQYLRTAIEIKTTQKERGLHSTLVALLFGLAVVGCFWLWFLLNTLTKYRPTELDMYNRLSAYQRAKRRPPTATMANRPVPTMQPLLGRSP